jgi:hypothetical protein
MPPRTLYPALGHSPSGGADSAAIALAELNERWRTSTLGEKQAFQHWFLEFCDALGVERPSPNAADDYCFEKSVALQRHDLTDGVGRIDCWKAGHFAVEAKGSSGKGSSEIHLRKAFKQVSDYVAAEPVTVPPYLMVVDVPRELIIWAGWRGGIGGLLVRIPTGESGCLGVGLASEVSQVWSGRPTSLPN